MIFDILFTTDCPQVINNTYTDESVTAYDVPKPKKKANLTQDDLFLSDTFSFGQRIGQITNYSTSVYSMLPMFKEGTPEYARLISRLKQCCVAQSKQIDKTKIGQNVKDLATCWTKFQKIEEDDTSEDIAEKNLCNKILVDKKPYFFKYKYKTTAKEIREFENLANDNAIKNFCKTMDELLMQEVEDPESLTVEEKGHLDYYHHWYPVIDTKCIMNNICHHIEDVDFKIKQKIKSPNVFDYKILMSKNFTINLEIYAKIDELIAKTFKEWEVQLRNSKKTSAEKTFAISNTESISKDAQYESLKNELYEICSNEEILCDCLVYLFYEGHPSYNKGSLWRLAGKQMFENIKNSSPVFYYPIKNENGNIEFLYEKYMLEKIDINEEKQKLEEKEEQKRKEREQRRLEREMAEYADYWNCDDIEELYIEQSVETSTGEQSVETSTGEQSVETSTGEQSVETVEPE